MHPAVPLAGQDAALFHGCFQQWGLTTGGLGQAWAVEKPQAFVVQIAVLIDLKPEGKDTEKQVVG